MLLHDKADIVRIHLQRIRCLVGDVCVCECINIYIHIHTYTFRPVLLHSCFFFSFMDFDLWVD